MKKILSLISVFTFLAAFNAAKADISAGVALMVGQTEVSGSEFENGAGSADKNDKTIKELFYGGSVFVELQDDSGFALGIDYVPVDLRISDIGSVALSAAILNVMATIYPAFKASRIAPAEELRFH